MVIETKDEDVKLFTNQVLQSEMKDLNILINSQSGIQTPGNIVYQAPQMVPQIPAQIPAQMDPQMDPQMGMAASTNPSGSNAQITSAEIAEGLRNIDQNILDQVLDNLSGNMSSMKIEKDQGNQQLQQQGKPVKLLPRQSSQLETPDVSMEKSKSNSLLRNNLDQ